MATTSISLEVSYGQLAVFSSSLLNPFNDWTDKHVAQGFAWRPGSASFRTLVEVGTHRVEVVVKDHAPPLDDDVVRAIEVPFEVPPGGAIEVASISDSLPLSLAAGDYSLRCEFMAAEGDGAGHVRLVFARRDPPCFKIHRSDEPLTPGSELLTTAEPAAV